MITLDQELSKNIKTENKKKFFKQRERNQQRNEIFKKEI